MGALNPKVTEYISQSQPFAQPVLQHLRTLVHKVCPEVEEEMKWSFPNFTYKGKILCSLAAFKHHCSFGFWLAGAMTSMEPYKTPGAKGGSGMGDFGKLTSVKDLPSNKIITACIKEAMQLTDDGVVLKKAPVKAATELPVPPDFEQMLSKNKKAKTIFQKFPPSHRKEYIQWITEAKTEATRQNRINTATEWIAEGKGRNWKYDRK